MLLSTTNNISINENICVTMQNRDTSHFYPVFPVPEYKCKIIDLYYFS